MLRSQLVERLARKLLRLSPPDVSYNAGLIIDKMVETLCQHGRIEVRGFGSFSLHYCPPRKARNPKTGKRLVTQPKYRPHFKAGKELREQINVALARDEQNKANAE